MNFQEIENKLNQLIEKVRSLNSTLGESRNEVQHLRNENEHLKNRINELEEQKRITDEFANRANQQMDDVLLNS